MGIERSATAQCTAISFSEMYGDAAQLHASVCAYQSLVANDVSGCRFWREVLHVLEQLGERNGPTGTSRH